MYFQPQKQKEKGQGGGEVYSKKVVALCGYFYGDVVSQQQETFLLFCGGAVDVLCLTDLGLLRLPSWSYKDFARKWDDEEDDC